MNDISLIIPAYNEAKYITQNLKLLTDTRIFSEIIVVDDGSTDDTASIVRNIDNIKLILLENNRGKTGAILEGVRHASHEIIAFYDADLLEMKSMYLKDMIETFQSGYDMVIMDKGAQPWIFRTLIQSIPAQSGTRVLRKSDFLKIRFNDTVSFDLEPRINEYYLTHNKRIAVTPAPAVHDPRKYGKYSFLKGLYLDLKAGFQILLINGIMGIPGTLRIYRVIHKLKQKE